MSSKRPIPVMSYVEPPATDKKAKQLVAYPDTPEEQRFTFYDRIEIGRYRGEGASLPGVVFILDPTVSSRHCAITQAEDGRCYIRDMSRNGTRLEGRRLVPNAEVAIEVGQSISVGNQHELLLSGEPAEATAADTMDGVGATVQQVTLINATVLVGDISDYTVLVQRQDSIAIQEAIRRVFGKLETKVTQLGGTVKEFRGDAILAFWEENLFENQAVEACRAALALDRFASELASDASIWHISDFPLRMDWALATGPVTIDSIGSDRRTGLSLIGTPVVLAFRIEKYANNETGPIVVCPTTRDKALGFFEFVDLGDKYCKGFDDPSRIYALVGPS